MTVSSRNSSKAIVSAMRYRDLDAAVGWLCRAFSFEIHRVRRDDNHRLEYAELSFGKSMLMLGSTRNQDIDGLIAQPDQVGGTETQSCYLLVDDVDALYVRATNAGATIVFDSDAEDADGRSFGCKDIEGHIWFFGSSAPQATAQQTSQPTQRKFVPSAPTAFAAVALGSLAIAIGLSVWQYFESEAQDHRVATAIVDASDRLRNQLSRESAARRIASEEKERLTKLLGQERQAMLQQSSVIAEAEEKLAIEEAKRLKAEESVRQAMAEIERERTQRKELEERARQNAQIVAELKKKIEHSTSALRTTAKQQEQERLANQESVKQATRLATLLQEEQRALEKQTTIIALTEEKLADEERKRRQAERSVREAKATIEQERALREALQKLAQDNAKIIAALKRDFEQSKAKLESNSELQKQEVVTRREQIEKAIANAEKMLVEERIARESAERKAQQTASLLTQQREALRQATESVQQTRQQLTVERDKRKAAEASIKKLEAALVRDTLSRALSTNPDRLLQSNQDRGLEREPSDRTETIVSITPPLPSRLDPKERKTFATGTLKQTDHAGSTSINPTAAAPVRRIVPRRQRSVAQRRAPAMDNFRLRRRVP